MPTNNGNLILKSYFPKAVIQPITTDWRLHGNLGHTSVEILYNNYKFITKYDVNRLTTPQHVLLDLWSHKKITLPCLYTRSKVT
jgi:hypothetical protein